jgi:hypothetical protein
LLGGVCAFVDHLLACCSNSLVWQLLPSATMPPRSHVAACALGIDELRERSAAILLLGRHAEQNALCAHVPVESLDIGNGAPFDLSRRILVGSRVQSECILDTIPRRIAVILVAIPSS